MIKSVAHIQLRDKSTWLDEPVVAVDSTHLTDEMIFNDEYFKNKRIILISPAPDEIVPRYPAAFRRFENACIRYSLNGAAWTPDVSIYNKAGAEEAERALDHHFVLCNRVLDPPPVIKMFLCVFGRTDYEMHAVMENATRYIPLGRFAGWAFNLSCARGIKTALRLEILRLMRSRLPAELRKKPGCVSGTAFLPREWTDVECITSNCFRMVQRGLYRRRKLNSAEKYALARAREMELLEKGINPATWMSRRAARRRRF